MHMNESESCSVMSDSLWPQGRQPTRLLCPWNSPGKNTEVGSHSLLQGIFLTQGLNLGLLHCRQILYHLSHRRMWVFSLKMHIFETSLEVQWLRFHASNTGSTGSIPGWWTGSHMLFGQENIHIFTKNYPLILSHSRHFFPFIRHLTCGALSPKPSLSFISSYPMGIYLWFQFS